MLQRLGRYEVLETLAGGGQGTGDGEFDSAGGVAAASDGSVYVTDPFQHRIQKFATDGAFASGRYPAMRSVGRSCGKPVST